MLSLRGLVIASLALRVTADSPPYVMGEQPQVPMHASMGEAYGITPSVASCFTGSPNLNKCKTILACEGQSATPTVHITTTIIQGIYPTQTITIFPSRPNDNGVATITILKPTTTQHWVTVTLPPGAQFPSITQPQYGEPGTIFVVQPGQNVPTTTTITTSIPNFNPTTTVTVLGNPPVPGGPATVLIIPPGGVYLPGWTCSCGGMATSTVTLTQAASRVPDITTTGNNGQTTAKPPSQFACSEDDAKPCKGALLQNWKTFYVYWGGSYPRSGPPAPFVTTVDFEDDGILTVTDDENKAEHFEVKLDGRLLGETKEDGFDRWKYCGKAADSCISKGWSHGYFPVPKGKHELSIQWTKGDMAGWWYGAGQYRFDKQCKC